MINILAPLRGTRPYRAWLFGLVGAACWVPAGMAAVVTLLPDWPRSARTAIFATTMVTVIAAAGLGTWARRVCVGLANRLLDAGLRPIAAAGHGWGAGYDAGGTRRAEAVPGAQCDADGSRSVDKGPRAQCDVGGPRARDEVSGPGAAPVTAEGHGSDLPRRSSARNAAGSGRWSARVRTSVWLVTHAVTGGVVTLTTGLLLVMAVSLPTMWLNGGDTFTFVFAEVSIPGDGRGAWSVAAAVALLLPAVGLVAVAAASWRWLAGRLLGPDASERLAAVEEQARDLARRNRLAQELHDSIGHTLTTSTIQAAVANQLMETDPESARRALNTIEESTRLALDDLDYVLGVLRRDAATREPQRTLADLRPLLDRVEATGAVVRRDLGEGLADTPSTVSREAYRVVQEAVTNALRHAPGEAVDVSVTAAEGELLITIANRLASNTATEPGRGLTGVAERVRLLGGAFDAGPDAAGGCWLLVARLPTA